VRSCSRLNKADDYSNKLLRSWPLIVECFRWTDVASSCCSCAIWVLWEVWSHDMYNDYRF